jgi:broad specificity phosphatase PhoE
MVKITYYVDGTTTDNENDLATGWLPGELSPNGIEQAKALGTYAPGQQFDAIFCSDLKRAVDSAQLGFGDRLTPIQDARLREANYGIYNGQKTIFKDALQNFIEARFPKGESYTDVEHRLRDFCTYLKANYDDRHIAIVAHQGPQLALDVILKGKTWHQAIAEDWRHTHAWQPGWEYEIN